MVRKAKKSKPSPGDIKNLTPGDGENLTPDDIKNLTPGDGENLTPGDGENLTASDQKEKRIFDISSVSGGDDNEQILHELPLQEIDDEYYSFRGDLSITAKGLRIIPAKLTAGRLKSYSSTSAAAVGLDSQIYSIGGWCLDVDGPLGEDDGCTDGCNGFCHAAVFCVGVDGQANKEWKRCHPMNIGRKNPLACAVDGKIYVFGGAWDGPFIGEVYDPQEDEWKRLPPLGNFSAQSPIAPMNVVLDDPKNPTNKLILVHIRDSKTLYAFNVQKYEWGPYDEEFGRGPLYKKWTTSPVHGMWPTNAMVGNVLYCYSTPGKFFAYDFKDKKWHNVHGIPESDQFHQTIEIHYPALFHLGGNTLCFLWSYPRLRGEVGDDIIGCAKFTVADESSLSLTPQRVGYFDHEVHAFDPRYVLL